MGGIITTEDWRLDSEYAEERHDARVKRYYQNQLNYHPDCRDPDHPGCQRCEPELFNSMDDEDDEDGTVTHRE